MRSSIIDYLESAHGLSNISQGATSAAFGIGRGQFERWGALCTWPSKKKSPRFCLRGNKTLDSLLLHGTCLTSANLDESGSDTALPLGEIWLGRYVNVCLAYTVTRCQTDGRMMMCWFLGLERWAKEIRAIKKSKGPAD